MSAQGRAATIRVNIERGIRRADIGRRWAERMTFAGAIGIFGSQAAGTPSWLGLVSFAVSALSLVTAFALLREESRLEARLEAVRSRTEVRRWKRLRQLMAEPPCWTDIRQNAPSSPRIH